jgi:hypothetical protein
MATRSNRFFDELKRINRGLILTALEGARLAYR